MSPALDISPKGGSSLARFVPEDLATVIGHLGHLGAQKSW